MLKIFRNRIRSLWKSLNMSEDNITDVSKCNSSKRQNEDNTESEVEPSKCAKMNNETRQYNEDKKRKIALLLMYSGAGYHGLQINKNVRTIEGDLVAALVKAGFIPPEHGEDMNKMCFQRASRTDKGVSAVGQIISLKMLINDEKVIEKINEHLPDQIRTVAYKRTTKGFNSKNYCDSRTYIYLMPTYALSPYTQTVTEEYRVTDDILQEFNDLLTRFKGTHNFHNFTSHVKPTEQSARRYMINLEVSKPFVKYGMEWTVVTIKGQSFMLHHIRKMIGLAVAMVRGFTGPEIFNKVFEHEKVDIPKVPGLGLMLDKLHYDGYNKRYGNDGLHERIEWSQYHDIIDDFKEKHIFTNIMKTEKEEHTMLLWLGNLHYHSYDYRPQDTPRMPLAIVSWKLQNPDKIREPLKEHSDELDDSGDRLDDSGDRLDDSGDRLDASNARESVCSERDGGGVSDSVTDTLQSTEDTTHNCDTVNGKVDLHSTDDESAKSALRQEILTVTSSPETGQKTDSPSSL